MRNNFLVLNDRYSKHHNNSTCCYFSLITVDETLRKCVNVYGIDGSIQRNKLNLSNPWRFLLKSEGISVFFVWTLAPGVREIGWSTTIRLSRSERVCFLFLCETLSDQHEHYGPETCLSLRILNVERAVVFRISSVIQ